MKTAREVLEKALDKYSFTRGYPRGGTESRDKAVSSILSDLSEIVMGSEDKSRDRNWNHAVYHIAKLFLDKEQTK